MFNRILIILITFISFVSKAQEEKTKINFDQLFESLIPSINSSQLIGVGESTHGTREFTDIRTKLFKELVEHHGFTIFFLEADYSAYTRINRFIQGSIDNSEEALQEVRLWPWITQEMLYLINWMQDYNKHNSNRIQFIGCDMQLLIDDQIECKRLSDTLPFFQEASLIIEKLNRKSTTIEIQAQFEKWKTFLANNPTPKEKHFHFIVQGITQWFKHELNFSNSISTRDSCMAENILNHLEMNNGSKGFFFAHNAHISMRNSNYNDGNLKRAGYFLSRNLKKKYYALGMDFKTGGFNAINYVDGKHKMQVFELKTTKRTSLANIYLPKGRNTIFLPISKMSKRRIYIHEIGSIYGQSQNGYKVYPYRRLIPEEYHGFIIIDKGSSTNLLKSGG